MNTCPRCGKPHQTEDRFCGLCGYNLTVVNQADFVTKRDMKLKDIQFDLGVLFFNDGKYTKAFEIFKQVYKENPDNLQVINMYNRTLEALNKAEG